MRPANLLYFYRLRLRTRRFQEALALIGVAVGVALLFAAAVANTSLTGSVRQLVDDAYGRADLQLLARDTRGFGQGMLGKVRALPGVGAAVPLVEVRANAVGSDGRTAVTLLGTDGSLAQVSGPALRDLRLGRLPDLPVIALPTKVIRAIGAPAGGPVTLEISGRVVRARVAAELDEDAVGRLARTPIAVAPLSYAQELAGTGGRRLTRILVDAEPGRIEAVERSLDALAADRLNVRAGDFDATLFEEAAGPVSQSTALFAGIGALVGFLFAFNAMLLTLPDRRRLVETLRLDGFRPSRVAVIVLFDALVLGVAASVVGLVLGDLLSRALFGDDGSYLSWAFPVNDERVVGWQSVAIAGATGIAATLLAALLPLADVARRRPVASARPRRIPWTGALFGAGVAALAVSVGVLILVPSAAAVGVVALVGALVLTLPAILVAVTRGLDRLLIGVRGQVPVIALSELRATAARSVAVAATGALAVFGVVSIQGARADLQAGLDRATHDVNVVTDLWVSPRGETNTLATAPIQADVRDRIAGVPGVRSVGAYRAGFLDLGARRVWVLAQPGGSPEPVPRTQLVDGDADTATARLRAGGWAVVSEAVAAELDLGVGDTFTLPSPRPRALRVAALSTNVGWAPGTVVLSPRDYARAWGTTAPTAFQVGLGPGASTLAARRGVARAIAGSALTVETATARERRHRDASREGLARLGQIAVLVLVAAVLAMAAVTGSMVWQRRARFAGLKLDGITDRTLWKALLLEAGVLLGVGCLVGALYGLLGQQLLDRALATVTGFPVVHSVAVGLALTGFLAVTVAAVALIALPSWLVARVPPRAAFQE